MKFVLMVVVLVMPGYRALAGDLAAERFEQMLAMQPDGVVFEIMTWEDGNWDWALPLLQQYVTRLNQQSPRPDLVLISHGAEMFELRLLQSGQSTTTIDELDALNAAGLEIHLDAGYARWKRLGRPDFPAFVDLAESADAMLADYRRLGFYHLQLERPDAAD